MRLDGHVPVLVVEQGVVTPEGPDAHDPGRQHLPDPGVGGAYGIEILDKGDPEFRPRHNGVMIADHRPQTTDRLRT